MRLQILDMIEDKLLKMKKLARSSICWLELNSPSLKSMNVARIEKYNNVPIRILDISTTPNIIKFEYQKNKDKELIVNYLKVWPLIAVCSVCVRDEDGVFKPKYIISLTVPGI